MKKINFVGQADFLPTSDTVDVRVLAANTAERHTIPAGSAFVLAASSSDFYIRWHNSSDASIPAADVTDGSGAEYKPGLRNIAGLTSFSIIAPATAVVSLAFFS